MKKKIFVIVAVLLLAVNALIIFPVLSQVKSKGYKEITLTTYYPIPYGSYQDLVVVESQSIGEIQRPTYPANHAQAGDLIPGGLTVSGQVAVGVSAGTDPAQLARFDIRGENSGNNADTYALRVRNAGSDMDILSVSDKGRVGIGLDISEGGPQRTLHIKTSDGIRIQPLPILNQLLSPDHCTAIYPQNPETGDMVIVPVDDNGDCPANILAGKPAIISPPDYYMLKVYDGDEKKWVAAIGEEGIYFTYYCGGSYAPACVNKAVFPAEDFCPGEYKQRVYLGTWGLCQKGSDFHYTPPGGNCLAGFTYYPGDRVYICIK
ncbi:MAG: hypothetical protein ABH872_01430 [Candidatus Omnitrophota bacterium]